MEHTCVALLDLDDNLRTRTYEALTQQGLTVYGCGDLASFYRVLDNDMTHAVLLRRTGRCAALVNVLVPQLRAAYALAIVVESHDSPVEDRLSILAAGADMCLDRAYDARELAAMLCAQARCRQIVAASQTDGGSNRGGFADSGGPGADAANPWLRSDAKRAVQQLPPQARQDFQAPVEVPAIDVWRLLYQGWVLVTPAAVQISLTGVERSFFVALAHDDKHELSREALSREKLNLNLKSISVAISRLRKKVQKSGTRLPLHTVHGMGYVFIGKLVCQDFS